MKEKSFGILKIFIKIILTLSIIYYGLIFVITTLFMTYGYYQYLIVLAISFIFTIPFLWVKNRKKYLYIFLSIACMSAMSVTGVIIYDNYIESITINTTPTIDVGKYLPFDENSMIVQYNSKTLKFQTNDELPIIDGAAALFPVYSAFVNAVYPNTTYLNDGVFEYNNTVEGYKKLAEKKTDIFIGAQPSKDQIEYAEGLETFFEYNQIGSEAFVFFVHKDNNINSLTTEQIKAIYSGEITNWKEVGGKDKEIVPFQRNKNSGSQSMMLRFMGDTPMIAPKLKESAGMGEIIEDVADYENRESSIGYSFRYYVEGIIKNENIKLIAIDGIAPTVDNIKNKTYPVITPVYAVSYQNNIKDNTRKLIDWILSDEGQMIIEETGYVGID